MNITTLASSSSGNCYQVSDEQSSLLIEAGLPFQRIRRGLGFKVSDLTGCLLSHEHGDHSKAIPDLLKAGVDCWMSKGTADSLGLSSHHRLHILKAKQSVTIDSWKVLPFDTQHDAEEPLGFLIESGPYRILYANDTYYVRYKFRGLTHIMLGVNYALDILRENVEKGVIPLAHKNRVLKSHMSLKTAKDFLRANDLSKVQEIYLLHLSDANSDEERFKQELQSLTGKPVKLAERG